MKKLSPREQEVLDLYLQEGCLRPVADALDISIKTARNQRSSLMRKLGVRNTVDLVRSAIQKGMIKP